jgi:hypothetical protein
LKKIVPLIAIIVVAIAVGVVLLQKPAPIAPPSKPETPTTPTLPETPIKISQKDLREEYDENPIAADEKYKGRIIITIGAINYIEERDGRIEVGLGTELPGALRGPSIICIFNDKKEVVDLKKGERIGIIGRNKGIESLPSGFSRLRFEDCHAVPLEKIKELKIEFDKETGTLKITNFGYDLKVKIKSPKGEIQDTTPLWGIHYYDKYIVIKDLPHRIELFSNPIPGIYSLIVAEDTGHLSPEYVGKILFEEKFEISANAKIEIRKVEGSWGKRLGVLQKGYMINSITISISNPEKVWPIIVIEHPTVEVWHQGKLLCKRGWFNFTEVLPAGKEIVDVTIFTDNFDYLTTNPQGGKYQITVRIYALDGVKEFIVPLEVPPFSEH